MGELCGGRRWRVADRSNAEYWRKQSERIEPYSKPS